MARKTVEYTKDSEFTFGQIGPKNGLSFQSVLDLMHQMPKEQLVAAGKTLAYYVETGHGYDGKPVRHLPTCKLLLDDAREIYRQRFLTPAGAAVSAPKAQPVATGTGWDGQILDGTYTVEFEGGEYRTLKIRTQDADASFKPGAQLISYLNGPDNWRNYQSFGEVLPGNQLKVWRKHESATVIIRAALALLAGPEAMIDGLKAYGRASGTCGMCGRKLTTPESIELGIGPICAGRVGL